jgi:hypothetical protein
MTSDSRLVYKIELQVDSDLQVGCRPLRPMCPSHPFCSLIDKLFAYMACIRTPNLTTDYGVELHRHFPRMIESIVVSTAINPSAVITEH